MGMEIEKKFLLKSDEWKSYNPVGIVMKQGYIPTSNRSSVRVRIAGDTAYVTLKSPVKGISRNEFEYEIPIEDAESVLSSICVKPYIEKVRYKIKHGNHLWEIDVFDGDNNGLVLAEIELKHENETFLIPNWIGEEVTGNFMYYNSNLAKYPYKEWGTFIE